jgi:hypothetical protein
VTGVEDIGSILLSFVIDRFRGILTCFVDGAGGGTGFGTGGMGNCDSAPTFLLRPSGCESIESRELRRLVNPDVRPSSPEPRLRDVSPSVDVLLWAL